MKNKIDILGVQIDATNLNLACQTIESWVRDRKKSYICVAPVSTVMECQKDEHYRKIVNKAQMITPDGMPIVWLGRLAGNTTIERTYGPDLMLAMCRICAENGFKIFLYGGTQETCQQLELNLLAKFPKLNIVGLFSPPFRPLSDEENQRMIQEINKMNPDILWVGLGSPKQDIWMYTNRDKLDVPVMVGVGAAFDFLSGNKIQAPRWIQRSGLEWLFRLCCEPRRLWRRYLIGNPMFLCLLLKDCLRKKIQLHT